MDGLYLRLAHTDPAHTHLVSEPLPKQKLDADHPLSILSIVTIPEAINLATDTFRRPAW